MPRKTWKDRLEPFAQDLMRRIASLSDADLIALDKAASKATETNVWWVIFCLRSVILEAVKMEIMRRSTRVKELSCGVAT